MPFPPPDKPPSPSDFPPFQTWGILGGLLASVYGFIKMVKSWPKRDLDDASRKAILKRLHRLEDLNRDGNNDREELRREFEKIVRESIEEAIRESMARTDRMLVARETLYQIQFDGVNARITALIRLLESKS